MSFGMSMDMSMATHEGSGIVNRTRRIVLVVAALALALLAYAWIDGGREPLRPIAEPVPVPPVSGPEGVQ